MLPRALSFSDHLLDDRGPAPPEQTLEDDEVQVYPDMAPPTPSMMVPATPVAQLGFLRLDFVLNHQGRRLQMLFEPPPTSKCMLTSRLK